MIRRLIQLYVGLVIFGLSTAMMIRSDLGLNPWDVFHQGVGDSTPLSFGAVVIITGAIVLLLWIPLRQRPGLGTISNLVVIGLAADLGLWLIPEIESLPVRGMLLAAGIVLNGIATSAYIGAGLGTGSSRRTHDRAGGPHRQVDPNRAHGNRTDGTRHRMGPWRHGGTWHGPLRCNDRADRSPDASLFHDRSPPFGQKPALDLRDPMTRWRAAASLPA